MESILVEFGNYLLSEERRNRFIEISEDNLEKRLSEVTDADLDVFVSKLIEQKRDLTIGQKAVGLNFNPSQSNEVFLTKCFFGSVVDKIQQHSTKESQDEANLKESCSIAKAEVVGSCMWTVKVITHL